MRKTGSNVFRETSWLGLIALLRMALCAHSMYLVTLHAV